MSRQFELQVVSDKSVHIAVTGCRVHRAILKVNNYILATCYPYYTSENGITQLDFFDGEPFHVGFVSRGVSVIIESCGYSNDAAGLMLTESELPEMGRDGFFIQPVNFSQGNHDYYSSRYPVCEGKTNVLTYGDGSACLIFAS